MSQPQTTVDHRGGHRGGPTVVLPRDGRVLAPYTVGEKAAFGPPFPGPPRSRVAYAAPHVVVDPLADLHAPAPERIDWEATLAFREHLWSCGFGVAEAMDTAQRGMGLDWPATRQLIERSVERARDRAGLLACGAGTDQLHDRAPSAAAVERSYVEQCEFIEGLGATPVVMASRALAHVADDRHAYERVYRTILSGVSRPVILHWLGDAFDPLLSGYWGVATTELAEDVLLTIVAEDPSKVDGIKLSVLQPEREISLRRRLPAGVRLYTGDDYHFPELIRGDAGGFSDALLGIFDPIAPTAAAALHALDRGDLDAYDAIFAPTVPLARRIFEAPTQYYKTGIVFLAYLNGHQSHFRMLGGLESARSLVHLAEVFVLADRAGALRDPELAAHRMSHVLALGGVAA